MSAEDVIGVQDEINKEKVKSLLGDLPTLAVARSRIDAEQIFCVSKEFRDIDGLFERRQQTQEETLFSSEEWIAYKEAITTLMNSSVLHEYLLDKVPTEISVRDIEELLSDLELNYGELNKEVARRCSFFLNYSLDLDVVLLRLKENLDDSESSIRLFVELLNDPLLQEMTLDVYKNSVEQGVGIFDREMVDVLVDTWVSTVGFKKDEAGSVKSKLTSVFYDEESENYAYTNLLWKDLLEDVEISRNLVGLGKANVGQVTPQNMLGEYGLLYQNARKLEIVRWTLAIEEYVASIIDLDLVEPSTYTVGERNGFGVVGNFVNLANGKINIGISEKYKIVADGGWLNEGIAAFEKLQVVGDGKLHTESVFMSVLVNIAIAMPHEKAHLKFVDMLTRSNFKNSDYVVGVLSKRQKIEALTQVDSGLEKKVDYECRLIDAISEGWSVLNEQIVCKALSRVQNSKTGDFRSNAVTFYKGRVLHGRSYGSYYWLGSQITSSVFKDWYLLNGSSDCKENDLAGLNAVKRFIENLDLLKIADPKSRRLFETTRFEEDVEAKEVRRKVWEEDGEKMRLVWKMDKKNTLLDYMTSTDPEKRRKGQERFLELFGKN